MKTNRKTQFIAGIMLLMVLLSACSGTNSAPAGNNDAAIQTAVAQGIATGMAAQNAAAPSPTPTLPACTSDPAQAAKIGQSLTAEELQAWIAMCSVATAATPMPAGQLPTGMPNFAGTPTAQSAASGADTSAYEGTATCEDGKNETPLYVQTPADIPWGTKEGATVAEIAWKPGTGFDGWYRINAIAERIIGTEMPYANDVLTLRVTQYCGSLQAIKDWAPTHVTAMVNSSQNSAGARPNANEIPIVLLKRDGSIEWVVQVTNGPSMEEIKAHLEMRP